MKIPVSVSDKLAEQLKKGMDLADILPKYKEENSSEILLKIQNLIKVYSGTRELPLRVFTSTLENRYFVLRGFERALVGTGLFLKIPEYNELKIRSLEDMVLKRGIMVVDAFIPSTQNMEKEVCFTIINLTAFPIRVNIGDEIAQATIFPVEKIKEYDCENCK